MKFLTYLSMRQDVVTHYVQEMHIHAACPFATGSNEVVTSKVIALVGRYCVLVTMLTGLWHMLTRYLLCSGIGRKTADRLTTCLCEKTRGGEVIRTQTRPAIEFVSGPKSYFTVLSFLDYIFMAPPMEQREMADSAADGHRSFRKPVCSQSAPCNLIFHTLSLDN